MSTRVQYGMTELLLKEKKAFKSEKLMAEILKISHENRTGDQKRSIIQLLQLLSFFQERKMKDKDINEICMGLKHQSSPAGETICRFGDQGETFYIILDGKCAVWLPMSNDKMQLPVESFYLYVKKQSLLADSNVSSGVFTIRDRNDQLITLKKLCDQYEDLDQASLKIKQQFWKQFMFEAAQTTSHIAQSFFMSKRPSVRMDQNDPFQLLEAKNKLVDQSKKLLFQRTFEKRSETVKGQQELLAQVSTEKETRFSIVGSEADFQSLQSERLTQKILQTIKSSESESIESDTQNYPTISNEQEDQEYQKIIQLQKKILADLFLNNYMPNHNFSIDDKNFDFYNGMYYFQISVLNEGQTFGELALLNADNRRNATVTCVTKCVFGVLDKRNFDRSLSKIEMRRTNQLLDFLQGIPCFVGMKRTAIQKFLYFMEIQKYIRNQPVYIQDQDTSYVYIVIKGEFEQERRLPASHHKATQSLRKILGQEGKQTNVLARKFTEIQSIPKTHKITIYGPGSLLGEEDVLNRKFYSSNLRCKSLKGQLYRLKKEDFWYFQNSHDSWIQIKSQAAKKEDRIRGKNIQTRPISQILEEIPIISQQQSPQYSPTHSPVQISQHDRVNSRQKSKPQAFTEQITMDFDLLDDYNRRNSPLRNSVIPSIVDKLDSIQSKLPSIPSSIIKTTINNKQIITYQNDDVRLFSLKGIKISDGSYQKPKAKNMSLYYSSQEMGLSNYDYESTINQTAIQSPQLSQPYIFSPKSIKDVQFNLGEKQDSMLKIAKTLSKQSYGTTFLASIHASPAKLLQVEDRTHNFTLGRQAISQEGRAYIQLGQILNTIRVRNKKLNPDQSTDFIKRSDLPGWVRKTFTVMQERK